MKIELLFPSLASSNDKNLTRSKILISVLLFTSTICLLLFIFNQFLQSKSLFPFHQVIIASSVLLLIFRWTESLKITTNLFVCFLAFVYFNLTLKTGGFCSADAFAIFSLPLLAFVLADIRSGLFWLVIISGWLFYLHSLAASPEQIKYFRNQTIHYDRNYYLLLSLSNLVVSFMLFSIFYFENKKLIQKLETQRNELEQKNIAYAQQTKILKKTQQQLKNSNLELEQYAHATSHDLKQPIRTINGFANLLKRNLKKTDALDERSTEFIDLIIKGSNNMLRLVNDLLSYAKLTATQEVPFEKLPLDQVLDNVLGDLSNQIATNNVTIDRSELPTLDVVPVKINQIFQNIISNAIKFKKKDEPLTIKISGEDKGTHWELAIEDNGIGIEKEHQEQIFAPFKKLHSEEKYAGSGIGLATCKRIVELHKGDIWVESEIDKGTKFTFTLPEGQRN